MQEMQHSLRPLSPAEVHNRDDRAKLAVDVKLKALEGFTTEELVRTFEHVPFFLAVTAVHGVEPQQIAVNMAMGINKILEAHNLEPKPILIPFQEKHQSYGARTVEVLQSAYPEQAHMIYMCEDLGEALALTEFSDIGYQAHWEQVKDNYQEVQRWLDKLVNGSVSAIPLSEIRCVKKSGSEAVTLEYSQDTERQFFIGEGQQVIEINAGANVSAATEDGRITSHCVFPVTLDGLVDLITAHPDAFRYEEDLVEAIGTIAQILRAKFSSIILPDFHTLREEAWFTERNPDVILTPPLKEKLTPPKTEFIETEAGTTFVLHGKDLQGKDTEQRIENFDREKGIVYMNISGSGIGKESVVLFVKQAIAKGEVVAGPRWLIEDVLQITPGHPLAGRVIIAGPELLFAKDEQEVPICKAFFMRPGMGSYAYAQLAGVPILSMGYSPVENPEMYGNVNVLVRRNIGRMYAAGPNSLDVVRGLAGNIAAFNEAVYTEQGISEDMEGIDYAARCIIATEMLR